MNRLYYGDNLDVLRSRIKDESVDLCYIDPPFNSKRVFNQIYDTKGSEDRAQEQAFIDTWTWDERAREGYAEIIANGRYKPPTIELVKGLKNSLGDTSLLAYLVGMTRRVAEIHRVLKPTGTFYFHCDPTSSHYLKLLTDSIFGPKYFMNEVCWKRSSAHNDTKQGMRRYGKIRDTLLVYTKSADYTWNTKYTPYAPGYLDNEYRHVMPDGRRYKEADVTAAKPGGDTEYKWPIKRSRIDGAKWEADLEDEYRKPLDAWEYRQVLPYQGRYWAYSKANMQQFAREGKLIHRSTGAPRLVLFADEMPGIPLQDLWTDIVPESGERDLGFPTQKPEPLLARVIEVSSNRGQTVLDAYCGCGTSVSAAQSLGRHWIGIDITYQSIATVLKRLADTFPAPVAQSVVLDGVPRDISSARALAHKRDDRVRKEFEKWAVLTYTNNRAAINAKKGADAGIDATAYFWKTKDETDKAVFQVKSGNVGRGDVAKLKGDMEREQAAVGTLITLEEPTQPMRAEAKAGGHYTNAFTGQKVDRVQIVTIRQILEDNRRLNLPLTAEVLATAPKAQEAAEQSEFKLDAAPATHKRKAMVKASLPLGFKQPTVQRSSKRGR